MLQWWRDRRRRGPSGTGLGNPARINSRGIVQFQKFERTVDVAYLEEALSAFQEAVSAAPRDHPGRAGFLGNLGLALGTRSEWRQDPVESDKAIAYLREAVSAMPADHYDWPGTVSNLGKTLLSRYRMTGHPIYLDEAVTVGHRAVSAAPVGHPGRPMFLANLAESLQERYERARVPADLDGAIDAGRAAAGDGSARHWEWPQHWATLAMALGDRFKLTGNQADLDEAIVLAHEALGATPAGHPNRAPMLFNLAVALRLRFERAGDPGDLDEAMMLMPEAVAASPAEHPNRSVGLSSFADLLSDRYEYTGDPADLEEAIETMREALAGVPTDHPSRSDRVGGLGNLLRIRYEHSGDAADLDEAVALCREAVAASPTDDPVRLSNLAAALQDRYGRTGQASDLNEAITRMAAAVTATPRGHVDRPVYLSNLGAARMDLYRWTDDPSDLDNATAALAEAVATTPANDLWRPARLSNLAATIMARYEQTFRAADLDEAVALFQEALTNSPPDHPRRPSIRYNLAALLLARHELTQQPADLDEAIAGFTEALAMSPADHPHRTMYLSGLAGAFRKRHEWTGNPAYLERAVAALQEGTSTVTAPPAKRLAAARTWGEALIQSGDPWSAVQAYTTAIELLAVVVWHGLDQSTREEHLREWAGLSADAAGAAVAAGALSTAVALLEAGRSILWAQARQLRQDLDTLRAQAPELAAELETARTTLADADPPGAERLKLPYPDQALRVEHEMLEQRRQAARAWDAAVDEVRGLTGLEHFLRPVPVAELLGTATAGPVVIVNISAHGGSQALLLTSTAPASPGGTVRVVDLPDAPMDAVQERTENLLEAQERPDPQLLFDVLAWEWRAITEPVLNALGCTYTPGGELELWPRVWWCPTGPAVLLPLHAAGLYPRTEAEYACVGERAATADTVAGRVVSSYTPTLTALARARTQPAPLRVRQLAVGVAEPPPYERRASPLPAVYAELRNVSGSLPAPEFATHLIDQAATHRAVLEALPEYSWLHLACHGVQDQSDADLSAFLLYDEPLTLADLTTVTLPEADLAYLSACQTATGDLDLTDEHLHLAAGMQLIGYRHVLATLWSIDDGATPAMAQAVYEYLTHTDAGAQPDANRAPYALHRAVARLRRSTPDDPLIWAPFIHVGP